MSKFFNNAVKTSLATVAAIGLVGAAMMYFDPTGTAAAAVALKGKPGAAAKLVQSVGVAGAAAIGGAAAAGAYSIKSAD